jgi:hypothetical protein
MLRIQWDDLVCIHLILILEEVHEAVEVAVETVEPAAVEKRLIGQPPV